MDREEAEEGQEEGEGEDERKITQKRYLYTCIWWQYICSAYPSSRGSLLLKMTSCPLGATRAHHLPSP